MNALPTNSTSQLNTIMCHFVKRTGQLCGSCEEGYGYPVYSYAINCVNCTQSGFKRNLLKYIIIAFVPLTIFYLFVVVFKISITSGNMVGYILTSQVLTMPLLLRPITRPEHDQTTGTLLLIAYFAIWNLDFFRTLYSPFCIHPKMTSVQVTALDYLIGVYPLLLIFLTYVAITLHDRYSIVVRAWKPAYRVFMKFRKEWDIRGSLVQAFSTFLVLSYMKFMNVSFDLLFPIHIKTVDNKNLKKTYLLNNPDMEYFGREHLPYGILAIFMLTTFNILPLIILLLYPCRTVQRCLNYCGLFRQELKAFVDTFQGCYRYKPRDCRYFAGLYLLVKLLWFSVLALVRDSIIIPITGFMYSLLAITVVLTQPYHRKVHNKADTILFLLHSQVLFAATLRFYLRPGHAQIGLHYMYIIAVIPMSIVQFLYSGGKLIIPCRSYFSILSKTLTQLWKGANST